MRCKYCKSEIISVKTPGGKWIDIDFSSTTVIDHQYLQMIDASKYPLLLRPEHILHRVSHPECYGELNA